MTSQVQPNRLFLRVAALKKKKSVFLVNTGIRENDKQWVKKIPQNCAYISWFKEEGGNISVDFPLFASLYKTKFITKS